MGVLSIKVPIRKKAGIFLDNPRKTIEEKKGVS